MMTERRSRIAVECQNMLDRVDQAAKNHDDGVPEDLSPAMLAKIMDEVQQMLEAINNSNLRSVDLFWIGPMNMALLMGYSSCLKAILGLVEAAGQ